MNYVYQVEALKDDIEELEENFRLVQKELKSKTGQFSLLREDHRALNEHFETYKLQSEAKFKKQDEDKLKLETNVQQLEEELQRYMKLLEESEKSRLELANKQAPATEDANATRENNKQAREYHYKWKMAEQENAVLQTSVNRLENQVTRLKDSLRDSEVVENDLKAEKRKLLRELREAQAKVEELETNNSHLQKRIDRMRSRNLVLNSTGDPVTPVQTNGAT